MLKNLTKKTKTLAVVGASALVTTNAFSAVTYDASTGLSGSVDLTAYNSAIPIVLTVVGVTIAVSLMFKMFGQAKRG